MFHDVSCKPLHTKLCHVRRNGAGGVAGCGGAKGGVGGVNGARFNIYFNFED